MTNPLIAEAIANTNGKLPEGSATLVDSKGSLNARNVIFVNPPKGYFTSSNDLKKCYQTTFDTFAKNVKPETTSQTKKLAITPFERAGFIGKEDAARIAVDSAIQYLRTHENEEIIMFVVSDEAEMTLFDETVKKVADYALSKNLVVIKGDIVQQKVDAIVCFMNADFNSNETDELSKRILSVANDNFYDLELSETAQEIEDLHEILERDKSKFMDQIHDLLPDDKSMAVDTILATILMPESSDKHINEIKNERIKILMDLIPDEDAVKELYPNKDDRILFIDSLKNIKNSGIKLDIQQKNYIDNLIDRFS